MLKDHTPSEAFRTVARTLGAMVDVELHSPLRRPFALSEVMDWFHPPLVLDQYAVFLDGAARPASLVTWAYVSDEMDQALRAPSAKLNLALEEWNEGRHLWLIDVVSRESANCSGLFDWAGEALKGPTGRWSWRRREGRAFLGEVIERPTALSSADAPACAA